MQEAQFLNGLYIFIILILSSRLINKEISEFLFLGMYIFLLQPGRTRE